MKRAVMLALLCLVHLLLPLVALRCLWAIATNPGRAWQILQAYDRLGNAATNDPDVVTISSRAAFARDAGKRWGCVLCKVLDAIQANHCNDAKGI